MNRRTLMLAALAAGIVLPTFAAEAPINSPMQPDEAALYEKAKQEGQVTWYVAQYPAEVTEMLVASFQERYPGIKVNVNRATGQVIYARLSQDIRAGVPQCDLFSGTDSGHFISLKERGMLMKINSRQNAKLVESFRKLDPDGTYYPTSLDPVIMAYNTKLIPDPKSAPTNWTDLFDPKWSGKAAVSHPGFSGSTGEWAVLMEKLYGTDFAEKFAKNKPQLGRSLNDPLFVVAAGERAFGITSISTAMASKRAGNPLAFIYPTDGAKVTLSGSGVLKNAPHPYAAQLLLDFLMSEHAGTRLVERFGFVPIRADVPPPSDLKPMAEVKIAPLTTNEIVANLPKAIERWRDAFGG